MKRIIWAISTMVVLVAMVAAWQANRLHQYAHQPAGSDNTPVVFSITSGEPFDAVARRLESKGLIQERAWFKWLARLKSADTAMKAGEFQLTAAMTPSQIIEALVSGKILLYKLTIPEGYTLQQIAQALHEKGLGDRERFVAYSTNPETAEALGIHAQTLEGYLFPDTYFFPKGIGTRAVVAKMVARFHEKFPALWLARCQEIGLTVHEVVTLASIIEKETGEASERPIIASVFHNRLRKRMRLESDPTVIYGIEDFDGNITRRHLKTPTPYNTYVIRGLPPGPIANPGSASIEAALYPARTDYLFFVSKKDRTHHFSTTIEEHNAAVRKYQLRRRQKPAS